MGIFQLMRILFTFLYDNFIGKEVSFKDAVTKHTNALALLIFFLISLGINVILYNQLNTTRSIAKANKAKYMQLKADRDELRENYVRTLISYDLMYRMHYDHADHLILHNKETGEPEGTLIEDPQERKFEKPPTLDEIVRYMNDTETSNKIIRRVHEAVQERDENKSK